MNVFCSSYSEFFPSVRQSSPVEVKIRGQPRLESVELSSEENLKIFCHNNIRDTNVQFKWFINDKLQFLMKQRTFWRSISSVNLTTSLS